ncbi:unnamed protein product, partial [Rotaria socialis]
GISIRVIALISCDLPIPDRPNTQISIGGKRSRITDAVKFRAFACLSAIT